MWLRNGLDNYKSGSSRCKQWWRKVSAGHIVTGQVIAVIARCVTGDCLFVCLLQRCVMVRQSCVRSTLPALMMFTSLWPIYNLNSSTSSQSEAFPLPTRGPVLYVWRWRLGMEDWPEASLLSLLSLLSLWSYWLCQPAPVWSGMFHSHTGDIFLYQAKSGNNDWNYITLQSWQTEQYRTITRPIQCQDHQQICRKDATLTALKVQKSL